MLGTLHYRIKQDGLVVASAEGQSADAEIAHYAAVYGQDGPITVEKKVGRRWQEVALA